MKYISAFVFIFFVAFFCRVEETAAQDDPTIYIQIDYMKTFPGMEQSYVDMEKNIWKKIHQERIHSGEILAWKLYQVQYPSGTETEYNYVTILVFSSFFNLDDDNEEFEEIIKRAHPDKSLEELNRVAMKNRMLIRSDVFRSSNRFPLESDMSAKSLLVDYMKVLPQNLDDYLKLELEVWKPLHKTRYMENNIKGWGLYELQFPGGTTYPYTHLTFTNYENWGQIKDSWPEDIWKRIHPSADQESLVNRTHKTRELVSTQIWKLLDFVSVKPKMN
jgi:hypothetical protein